MYAYESASGTFSTTLPMDEVSMMLAGPLQTFDGIASVTFTANDTKGNGSLNDGEFNKTQMRLARAVCVVRGAMAIITGLKRSVRAPTGCTQGGQA
jgi:hypothetical protein